MGICFTIRTVTACQAELHRGQPRPTLRQHPGAEVQTLLPTAPWCQSHPGRHKTVEHCPGQCSYSQGRDRASGAPAAWAGGRCTPASRGSRGLPAPAALNSWRPKRGKAWASAPGKELLQTRAHPHVAEQGQGTAPTRRLSGHGV